MKCGSPLSFPFAVILAVSSCSTKPPVAKPTSTPTTAVIAGYRFSEIPELGGGILLEANSRFKFALMYGVVNRFATGAFKLDGDHIVLESDPAPDRDFNLVNTSTSSGGLSVRIVPTNDDTRWISGVECVAESDKGVFRAVTGGDGLTEFATGSTFNKISLRHLAFPDRVSTFVGRYSGGQALEFQIQDSIVLVRFHNVRLQLIDNALRGHIPVLADYAISAQPVTLVRARNE